MAFGTVRVTSGTPMPETALELIDGIGVYIIAIHSVATVGDVVFSPVGGMLNSGGMVNSACARFRLGGGLL